MANKKDVFVNEINEALLNGNFQLSEDARMYFEAFQTVEEKEKKKFTENGRIILQYMRDNKSDFNNLFKAKDFEGAGLTSKTASGSIRKLVSDGYVEKMGQGPVIYSLTSTGETISLDEE